MTRPGQENLNITIVDGFCGGGRFLSAGNPVDGSPLTILHAVQQALQTLNHNRQKPVTISAEFHFVDSHPAAIDELKRTLASEGFGGEIDKTIFLHTSEFVKVYPAIRQRIEARTKRGVGRSIFFLDQKGYKQVPFEIIRDILGSFTASEVLLTFATDFLLTHMTTDQPFLKAVAPIGLTPATLERWIEEKGQPGWRYLVQRGLKDHIQQASGARFISPFFIRSEASARDLWIVHLSRHRRARNVMVDTHWQLGGYSRHPGRGGLEIVGFDLRHDPSVAGEMLFMDDQKERMTDLLREDIQRHLQDELRGELIPFGKFMDGIVNLTPAPLSDIQGIISASIAGRDIDLLTSDRSLRRGLNPKDDDLIRTPNQPKLFP